MKDPQIVTELTPELADKIWNSIRMKMLGYKLSKEGVLHQLKQIKAQIGKVRRRIGYQNDNTRAAIDDCLKIIDKKIEKINKIR